MTTEPFNVNWGSDLQFDIPWPNGAGGNADLTGWTVSLLDVSDDITGLVTVESPDLSTGVITVRLEWSSLLLKSRTYRFRVQISKDGEDQSTNLMRVIYR